MKRKIFALTVLVCMMMILVISNAPPAQAANFNLTVHVDQRDKNGNIAPLAGAAISVQRCNHTSPNDEACTAWSDTIKYNTTAANGEYTFALAQDYRWRVVATMDNRWCDVPTDCKRVVVRHDSTAITPTIQLHYPRYPGDGTVPSTEICPTRSRNGEVQRKVVEGGIAQSQVATENTNFSAWYHSWEELPTSGIYGNIVKIDPRDPFTTTQVQQASAIAPNSWWIIGEEPNAIQRGGQDTNHDGTLYSSVTVSTGSFNVNIVPNTGTTKFATGALAVINNTVNGGTDAYTRVVINSWTDNGAYWTYNVSYSGGASSGTYPSNTTWGWWPTTAQTPEEYATYYRTMSQAILQGSSGAKIIMGYLGQYYPKYIVRPWEYFERVVTTWKAQNAWCAEPPMDAFHSNFFPFLDKNGTPVSGTDRADPAYTTDYLNLWRDQFFDGQAQAWLTNERFSLGTSQTWEQAPPTQEEANRYLQYTVGNYLNPNKYDWLIFQMNFSGYSPIAGMGNLLNTWCTAQPCAMTDYGEVFANAVYGNAGWELGDLSRWETCVVNPPMFSVLSGGPSTPIKSKSVLKFYTTTAYGCDIVSDKYPLNGSSGTNLLVELDYRILQGNSDSDFYVEFYDANGVNLGSTNSCPIVSGVTGSWQHASCTFPLSAFSDAASIEFVIVAFPSGSGTKDFRFDNASVIVLP